MFLVFLFAVLFNYVLSNNEDVLLERWVLGSGFHREIKSQVLIPGKYMWHSDMTDCRFVFQETLPSGLYVDVNQLEGLRLKDAGPFVHTKDEIDVEKPEYLSKKHTIYVYGDLYKQVHVSSDQVNWKGIVQYPVHVRYHRPSTDTRRKVSRADVSFEHPKVLVHASCVVDRYVIANTLLPCGHRSDALCSWVVLPYVSERNALDFEVPVGRESHQLIVTMTTVATTVLGCGLLILGSLYSNRSKQKAE